MASNLRVDNIQPTSGTGIGIGTAGGTITLHNDIDVIGHISSGGNINTGVGNSITAENFFFHNGRNVSVPAGTVIYTLQNAAPEGYIKANGATISRTAYADLFASIGVYYGAGDGSTTFAIPDLRGEFLRAWDDGRGIDSGRAYGTAQAHAQQNITGSWWDTSTVGAHGIGASGGSTSLSGGTRAVASSYRHTIEPYAGSKGVLDSSQEVDTADEVRPRNIALLACIKY